MKAPQFEKVFAQLALLNQAQRQQVLAALHPAAGLDRVVALIGEIRSKERCCPDCGCERCHRHGHANDLQRFRRCACGRTFNDLTGTPLGPIASWPATLRTSSTTAPDAFLDRHPIRRIATLEEVAALVNFLAGQNSSHLTGGIIDVAGGLGI